MKYLNKLKLQKLTLIVALLPVFLTSACKVKYPPPKVETCIHNQDASAECNDLRLPKEAQDYTREDMTNYICTNTTDYDKLYQYASKLREDLVRCEANKLDPKQ